MSNDSPSKEEKRKFRVALSFAGENRQYIKGVAQHLANNLTGGKQTILYDKYHTAEFARYDLDEHLPPLYTEESDLVVVFLCDRYDNKSWTRLEWKEIVQLRGKDNERVMLFLFKGSSPTRLKSTDGYVLIDDDCSSRDAAEEIITRLRQSEKKMSRECKGSAYDPSEDRKKFLEFVQKKIRKVLSRGTLECLEKKLSVDEGFSNDLKELCSIKCLQRGELFESVFETFFEEVEECWNNEFDVNHAGRDAFEKGAKEIFGWLILLTVRDEDSDIAQALRLSDEVRIDIRLPLSTLASVEIVASRLNKRCSGFTLTESDKVVGVNHVFPPLGSLDVGPSDDVMVLAVKEALWFMAMGFRLNKYTPEVHDKELDGELKARKKLKRPYYLPVLKAHENDPLNNAAIYNRVLADLKNLGAVFLCGSDGRDVFITSEEYLVSLMRHFLKIFGDQHEPK